LLVSNSVIPQNMKRFKWHILPLVRGLICGKTNNALNSGQVEIASARIVETMAQHGTAATEVFTKVTKICQDLGSVTPDQLKRQCIPGIVPCRREPLFMPLTCPCWAMRRDQHEV
jgi:hypothetical protein